MFGLSLSVASTVVVLRALEQRNALGIAYGSAALFGVSFALGAFFAGEILSESELSHKAGADSLPLQDAFAVLFFVSVGMLFDPSILLREPLAVLAVVAVIVIGKSLAAFLIVLASASRSACCRRKVATWCSPARCCRSR